MALCYLQQIRKLKQLLKRIGRDTNPFLHFFGGEEDGTSFEVGHK